VTIRAACTTGAFVYQIGIKLCVGTVLTVDQQTDSLVTEFQLH